MAPIFLSAEQCRDLLTPDDVLAAIGEALRWDGAGRIQWPAPRNLNIVPDLLGNHYHLKACVLEDVPVGGIRLVVHPADETSGVATRWVVLIDPKTTLPLAIVDERWNYAQRTVAAVASASRLLARRDARTLAVVGAGRLAAAAFEYYTRLFQLEEVRVASRREETRKALAEASARKYGLRVRAAETVEAAVGDADLVLTCTSAGRQLLEESWISPGTVVAALETAEPGRELAEQSDLLIVDSREQLQKELIAQFGPEAPGWVDATIGEVAAGMHPGRTSDAQRILIVTQGMASQDVALAHRAYVLARAKSAGTPLPVVG
jgi:ornithine cyclodeaminase/alanine dehydrogenase-like protein (mu-crystallin family)